MKPATFIPLTLCLFVFPALLQADEASDKAAANARKYAKIKAKLAAETSPDYSLRYLAKTGEEMTWKVTHVAQTETKIIGNLQTSRSRSLSTKCWTVLDVDKTGKIKFSHMVKDVDMWHKVSDRPEIRFNSREDKLPPAGYEGIASNVGKPISTFLVTRSGQVEIRKSAHKEVKFGLGQVTMPLPDHPIKIGYRWSSDGSVRVRKEDKTVKQIKLRHVHQLKSVVDDVATIKITTEIMSPVNDARIKSQLVQQLTKGEVKFDIKKGRIVQKEISWDETVIGFNGPNSSMRYLAKFTETLQDPAAKVAAKPAATKPAATKPAAVNAPTVADAPPEPDTIIRTATKLDEKK